ncbi:hypothetical protein [Tuwongella immobilis]|uniref:CorA-like Mg2+ transporter protein n=1 Tax=Tuwongella immobilis TaxID=692036 RepID=A0A6C2YTW7_9BACT|nr:hypothetical protein [Tuwongella immobilis]VIP04874.1 Uncharacterized protein OS=Clostridium sp. CAG:465 GN=BN667_00795 PE=4 SV=1 [Tuwongella immobilis]VTS07107.1 Uncharacterized protein OS=Clostridium sp. CAG:465 GN=BN667_00795 PE=4 SV=1 [Tuwongella immobilis]
MISTNETASTALRLAAHHSLVVLPFRYRGRGAQIAKLEQSPRWIPREYDPSERIDSERVAYFLPYIRGFFFPLATDSKRGCRHYRLRPEALGLSAGEKLRGQLHGADNIDNARFVADLRLQSVELLLSPFEVGFLILDFRCESPLASFEEQMKALGMLRQLEPLYLGQPLPIFETPTHKLHMRQWVSHFLLEFGPTQPGLHAPLPTLLNATDPLPVELLYGDRMLYYAFSCLDKQTAFEEVQPNEVLIRKCAMLTFDDETREAAKNAREKGLRNWLFVRWQGFVKEGSQLVAFNNEPFDETYLAEYHRTYYFDVFLLAMLQRVTLLLLYERLADIPSLTSGGRRSRRILRRLRHDLLAFRNQCCFSQITLKERGLYLWRRWQGALENETLLKEVTDQAQELDQYLQAQNRERMEWVVRISGALATVVPAILGLNAILGDEEWVARLKWGLLALVVVIAGIATSVVLFAKPRFDQN